MDKIEKLVNEMLRKSGYAFPQTEEELEEMINNLETKPVSESFIDNVCKNVIQNKEGRIEISSKIIKRIQEEQKLFPSQYHTSFLAAARNQGKLSSEIEKQLEIDRKILDQQMKNKESENK